MLTSFKTYKNLFFVTSSFIAVINTAYAQNLPPQIISAIKSTELKELIVISGGITKEAQIIRTKNFNFSPKSVFNWKIPNVINRGNYVVIAANRITVNVSADIKDISLLNIVPHVTREELKGSTGSTGNTGWTSGSSDGSNGLTGNSGGVGQQGNTYNYPNIYIIFQEIVYNIANPSIPNRLKIEAPGLKGGDGGMGGRGGDGGRGSQGYSDDRDSFFCRSGPGIGGNGGNGGTGGRGGDAGYGGNGANIYFIGPQSQHAQINRLEILYNAGLPGSPGHPGHPGAGGQAGGGGSFSAPCNGRDSGSAGGGANPQNLGFGLPAQTGIDGNLSITNRDNSDLFIVP